MRYEDKWPGGSYADLQRELDQLAAALGHSVSLDGPDGALLGHSSQGADVDAVRVNAVLTRRVPADVLAYQRSFGIDTATAPIRIPANAELGMAARTCLPVRRGRRVVAYLWVLDQAETLDTAALQSIRTSGERIRALVQPAHPTGVEALLAQLFTDRPRPDLLNQLAQRKRLMPSQLLQFAVVIATTTDGAERMPVPTTDPPPQLARSSAVLGTAWERGQWLMLLNAPGTDRNGDQVLRQLLTQRDGLHHVTGHSAPFRASQTDVSTLAARAIVAAGCAAVDGALSAVAGWDGLGPYRWLLLHTRPDSWPEPLPIPDNDRSAATLRHTLETFLDHSGDAARCISTLGIHRTTYYYRLDRLSSQYGVRLAEGLSRTDYHLALKTRRLQQARDTFSWTNRFLARLA